MTEDYLSRREFDSWVDERTKLLDERLEHAEAMRLAAATSIEHEREIRAVWDKHEY